MAREELLELRVDHGNVDVRLPAVRRRHRPLEREAALAVRPDAATAPPRVAVRTGLPEDDECSDDRAAVTCSHDSGSQDVPGADLRAPGRGYARLAERPGCVVGRRLAGGGCADGRERGPCRERRDDREAREQPSHLPRGYDERVGGDAVSPSAPGASRRVRGIESREGAIHRVQSRGRLPGPVCRSDLACRPAGLAVRGVGLRDNCRKAFVARG